LPQGSLKKIEFQLLLADLAFKLADALARRRQILARFEVENPGALARPARRPQCFHPATTEMRSPIV
jgi:hypothetical protein